uniref:Uncharacterized protein n=1 Tax=Caenorhabditis japonica TaxID=281687 RepID=A0A8R1E2B1_CAEJA
MVSQKPRLSVVYEDLMERNDTIQEENNNQELAEDKEENNLKEFLQMFANFNEPENAESFNQKLQETIEENLKQDKPLIVRLRVPTPLIHRNSRRSLILNNLEEDKNENKTQNQNQNQNHNHNDWYGFLLRLRYPKYRYAPPVVYIGKKDKKKMTWVKKIW